MAMTEKKFDTRILLKYDTLDNWNSSELILKAGEVAIAVVPVEGAAASPVVIKVGDGTRKFSELEMVSALASDVYSWAKKDEASFKTWLDKTAGFATDDELAGVAADLAAVDAAYKKADKDLADLIDAIQGNGSAGEGGGLTSVYARLADLESVLVSYMGKDDNGNVNADAVAEAIAAVAGAVETLEGKVETAEGDIEALEGKMTTAEGDIEALKTAVNTTIPGQIESVEGQISGINTKIGEVAEDKTVVGLISEASTAASTALSEAVADLEAADTGLEERVEAVEGAVTILKGGSEVEGSVAHTVATEIAKVVANAPEDFDTLKEIADWIGTDTTGAAQMQTDIGNLKTTTAGHTESIADLEAEDGRLEDLIEGNASGILALQGRVEALEQDGALAALTSRVEANEGAIAALQTADEELAADIEANGELIAANTKAISDEETRAKGVEESLLSKIDKEIEDARAAESKLTTDLAAEVTRATEAEEAIAADIEALADIAKTGSVVDLVQPADVEIIFDCGNSAARVAPQA